MNIDARAATNNYFHYCRVMLVDYFLNLSISCLVYKMSENGEKCVFPKPTDDVLNMNLVLSITQTIFSLLS